MNDERENTAHAAAEAAQAAAENTAHDTAENTAADPPRAPQATASNPDNVLDSDRATFWTPAAGDASPWIEVDFGQSREFGGLTVHWLEGRRPARYAVDIASVPGEWKLVREVSASVRSSDPLYLPESDARFVRLRLLEPQRGMDTDTSSSAPGQRPALSEIEIESLSWSTSRETFFQAIASEAPRGAFPRGFINEQAYWTVVGVDGDRREALFGEDGAIEAGAGLFSIEPLLTVDPGQPLLEATIGATRQVHTWADAASTQSLEQGSLPIPSVHWPARPDEGQPFALTITPVAHSIPSSSSIAVRYRVENPGKTMARGSLVLAVRPFQVNPPSQWLNILGGTARIRGVALDRDRVRVEIGPDSSTARAILCRTRPDRFGATTFDGGDIVADYLMQSRIPDDEAVSDPFEAASAMMEYRLELAPGASRDIVLDIPLYAAAANAETPHNSGTPSADAPASDTPNAAGTLDSGSLPGDSAQSGTPTLDGADPSAWFASLLEDSRAGWSSRTDRVTIDVPPSAAWLVETFQAQIGYILVNRAGPGIQPGTRSYARSWIRDGALTSSALLRVGLDEPVREFLEWYAPNQYANGKIPCVVDTRGADPVPEHDSSGEFIFLVAEYWRYTHDRQFVQQYWPRVQAAARYLDSLRKERRTEEYLQPGKRHFYGLLPPSISHEGYSAKPMHSYWDDLWALRGFRDAVTLAELFGTAEEQAELSHIRDEFARDLAASVDAAMQHHGIDFVPGCADLGDFDATSTTMAISPVHALDVLPRAAIERTFERYWEFFESRASGTPWDAYTPYELRNISAFVQLGWKERAHEALSYFFADQKPTGWRQWPEVVSSEPRKPRFLGDLPHTWVGSDYMRAFLDMFVFFREEDRTLVLGAGVIADWVAPTESGVDIALPTHLGPLRYRMMGTSDSVTIEVDPGLVLPDGGIEIRSPRGKFLDATVNGETVGADGSGSIRITSLPVSVVMRTAE